MSEPSGGRATPMADGEGVWAETGSRISGTEGIVKLRLPAALDAQHGGFSTGWSPVYWGSIDEMFVNLTTPP